MSSDLSMVLNISQIAVFITFSEIITRKFIRIARNNRFKFYLLGKRVHHWFVGFVLMLAGVYQMFFNSDFIILIAGFHVAFKNAIPAVITSGFRLLIDDFRDLREQIRNTLLRLKRSN